MSFSLISRDSGLDKWHMYIRELLKILDFTNWCTWLFCNMNGHKQSFSVSGDILKNNLNDRFSKRTMQHVFRPIFILYIICFGILLLIMKIIFNRNAAFHNLCLSLPQKQLKLKRPTKAAI